MSVLMGEPEQHSADDDDDGDITPGHGQIGGNNRPSVVRAAGSRVFGRGDGPSIARAPSVIVMPAG